MDNKDRVRGELLREIARLRDQVSSLMGTVDQLTQREGKFQDIVENMQEGFLEVDLKGSFTFVNGAMSTILGYTQDELLGMNYRQYADAENARKVFQRYNEVYRTGLPATAFEWQVIRKDGSRRDVEVSVALIRDLQGNPMGFRSIVLDITEKKRAMEELRKSEELYRLLAEKMTDVVWIMDLNLRTIYVSPSIEKMLGFTVEERLQQDVREQLTPASLSIVFQRFAAAMEQEVAEGEPERSVSLELEFYHKDGSTRWLESIVNGIRDERGRLIRLHGVSRDITKRRHLEEELKQSEQRWKFALEGAGDGVWDWNAQTDKVFFSQQWKAMLGYGEEEIGDGLEEWERRVHPEDKAAAYADLDRHFRGETPVYQNIHRLRCKDGTYKWILDRGKVIQWTADGKPLRVIGTHTDLTERIRLEEKLRESERKFKELSILDELTGLFNFRFFNHQLQIETERSCRYGHPLTMLMIDLDNFKDYNDTYGHVAGDEVLARFGDVVKRCLRHADTAYRYGGEEFAVLLPMTVKTDALTTAERIRREFRSEKFTPVPGREITVTATIGLEQYQLQEDPKDFVARTDRYLYEAKRRGKDRVWTGGGEG